MSNRESEIKKGKNQFGTFKGVFLPSVLTIFGVIMYLRMGWVVGNVGIFGTIFIVSVSSAITLITAFSISSIATNMRVGAGGAYFMISRSLGVEAGAAIGIPLFFARAIGIAFYISGFAESMRMIAPGIPVTIVAVVSLILMTLLAYLSADIALKASMFILVVIIASLFSFFLGIFGNHDIASVNAIPEVENFWVVFAVFFPAVTGAEAGLSMSGDLKEPGRSIPIGTISAVLLGYVVYLAIPILLRVFVSEDLLRSDLYIVEKVARWRWLIIAGVWGASLSSSLGSLLGAPRTLQALARDKTMPSFLGKGHSKRDTPRVATAFAFFIALAAILMGDLDAIAPVLTMFFLVTYAALNLVAALEGMIGNPSWRPAFRTPWPIALLGSALCMVVMFMISAGATFISAIVVAGIYYFVAKRKFASGWIDIRRSVYLALSRYSIFKLIESEEHAKTWRPNILVLSGSPTKRMYLIELADAISHGKGFMTTASIHDDDSIREEKVIAMEKVVMTYLKEKKIPSLVEVIKATDRLSGVKTLISAYGIGPLTPNTVFIGASDEPGRSIEFAKIIKIVYAAKRNLVIVRENRDQELPHRKLRKIICWWGGRRNNANLMLVLSYLLQTSPEWRGSRLSLKTVVRDDREKESFEMETAGFTKSARLIADLETIVHPYGDSPLATTIKESSQGADLVMLGIKAPGEDESDEQYASYYEEFMQRTEGYPLLAAILIGQDIKFSEIFS